MKKHSHRYSQLGDYADTISSTPVWVLALKWCAFYTLIVVAIVGVGSLVLSMAEFMVK
jgi:hypothetical protein